MEIAIWLQVEEERIPCVNFELLQNIDKNIVVIQFITKITITCQWRHLCIVFLVDFVPNIGDHT